MGQLVVADQLELDQALILRQLLQLLLELEEPLAYGVNLWLLLLGLLVDWIWRRYVILYPFILLIVQALLWLLVDGRSAIFVPRLVFLELRGRVVLAYCLSNWRFLICIILG